MLIYFIIMYGVVFSVINQLNAQSLFIMSLLYAIHVFSTVVLIIRRSELYYKASGRITPAGGRTVHNLRKDCAPDGHLQCDDTRCCIIQL